MTPACLIMRDKATPAFRLFPALHGSTASSPPVELGHTHAWCPVLSAEGFQSHAKNEERTQGPALTDA